ncbi:hypothetical protein CGJ08_01505 [Vibrio parahaemolyticus]|uniref:hypothetical protein n=1 Tax=Vibrio parahaemolyticus TaxID=670 RepID=UPI001124391F|nr:hypothetical protein [Vibrio parahaemolyticus]TOG14244.1 hypothetical protein CGJ08_01505 [Vibrio parahaemolyticus]HCG9741824.1 hypothetical protein [Vibrio parahaemolyticus]
MSEITYRTAICGEVKSYVYGGKNCDEHENYIETSSDGDMNSEQMDNFGFDSFRFPAGTKFIIQVPVCPNTECNLDAEFQNKDGKCECGFDWKDWAEKKYS